MIRSTLFALGMVTICATLSTGCAAQKAEHERLINERNQLQSQYDAATTQNTSLSQRVADLTTELNTTKAELEKTKSDMAAEEKTAETKQAMLTETAAKSADEQRESAAALKRTQDDLAAAKANFSAQSTTLTEKIVGLQTQIEDLSKDNASLKAELKEKTTRPAMP